MDKFAKPARDVRLRGLLTRRIPIGPARRCCRSRSTSGRLIDDVWQRWLELDPVGWRPRHADALRSMRRIYLDAGKSDEYHLDLGAQAFADELDRLGVEHTLELFDGKHGGLTYRYPAAIRELVLALSELAAGQRPMWMPIRSGSPLITRVSGPGPPALLLEPLLAQDRPRG